jgi:Domain of unknown function (DUF4158)
MPPEFLTPEQRSRYGCYNGEPSPDQLTRYFHLDDADLARIRQRRGEHNRFGFALQLCTVRFLGTFLHDPGDVPMNAQRYVAHQIGLDTPPDLTTYHVERTHWRHIEDIQRWYGYHEFTHPAEYFRLVRWLYSRAWLSAERPSLLFDLATAQLVERKVLLPGVTVLERLVGRVQDRAARRLWRLLAAAPTASQRARLEGLLDVPEGRRHSHLDRLRHGPHRVSAPALVSALQRLQEIRLLGMSEIDLERFPSSRIQMLARYAAKTSAAMIARMPDTRRIATLLAFAKTFEMIALDDALDVFDGLMADVLRDAKNAGEKARLRTLRDLDAAALALHEACAIVLDDTIPSDGVREAIFAHIPRLRLQEASVQVATLARPADDRHQQELVACYGRVRGCVPVLLRTIAFQATPVGQTVLHVLVCLATHDARRQLDAGSASLEGIPRAWLRRIIGRKGQVDRRAYTVYALERLQDGLQRRDVYVHGSQRWGDPRVKLLHGTHWEALRPQVCRALGHQETADQALAMLTTQLDTAYRQALTHLPSNTAVRFEGPPGREELMVSNLDKLEEPPSLVDLREHVAARLPRVDLPEVLLEVHAWTGFAHEFVHISAPNARVSNVLDSWPKPAILAWNR